MNKPKLLDLFCGAGGCAKGYADADFEVIGVDIAPQPHYPYEFHQADALTFPLDGFDVIHASPPCQAYTRARYIQGREHPELLDITRQRLQQSGLPWVIENVQSAPMSQFLMLCGTHFDLKVYRHRQFESSHFLFSPGPCSHPHELMDGYVCIYGHHVRGRQIGKRNNNYKMYPVAMGRAAMGIDWNMTQKELSQAIPPAYTRWIGKQLIEYLCSKS